MRQPELSECVGVQKDNQDDSLKGDITFSPHADSTHYMAGPLFQYGQTCSGRIKAPYFSPWELFGTYPAD